MAYNKSKYVDAALKFLHQGKLAQAIGEYQQILKHEPKDQVTLMTVGDLFVRQGDTFQALEYFERLAQLYLTDGFVSKAIAIYKKIAKLAPEESRPVEKLAELYVQQGVLSEARPIYLQLAEMHHRAGRHAQAAALLKKLLDAEPDNLRAQTKYAEISLAAGAKADAAGAYVAAARQLLTRGDHADAIKMVDKALHIEPSNGAATALKVRIHAASGQQQQAISMLESSSDLDQGGETATLLLDLYLETERTDKATELASKIFARNPKNFAPVLRIVNTFLSTGDADRALEMLDKIRGAMTDAGENEALSQSLAQTAERFPDRIDPLQWLVELYERTSDTFRLPDALANLGKAHEAAGRYDEALKAWEQLLDRDPEKESVRNECERLRALAGVGGTKPASPNAAKPAAMPVATPIGDSPVEETQPASLGTPAAEPGDSETEKFLAQALTDVDLFSSYGLTQKATDLLETVLNRVPGHPVALERLLDLNLGAGNERRTAELSAQLEQIHRKLGDSAQAERFAELRRRFERNAEPAPAAPVSQAPLEFAVPTVDAEPVAESVAESVAEPAGELASVTAADAAESSVHEVDLSEEWAALVNQVESGTPAADSKEAGVLEAARATEVPIGMPSRAITQPQQDTDQEWVLELDSAPEAAANGRATAASTTPAADDVLGSLAAELNAAMPALTRQPDAPPQSRPAPAKAPEPQVPVEVPVAAAAKASLGPLGDVFDQFRADLGDSSAESEDLETHYNLGIAYREMGLLEEAISEFQKVAKAQNSGTSFRYSMQCCTLLGLAFMERGQPSIAAMWYERALDTPGLDQETVLALRYDLGVAQELAGDASAARKSFSQVYGMNIDYRDVGERLAALGKEQR